MDQANGGRDGSDEEEKNNGRVLSSSGGKKGRGRVNPGGPPQEEEVDSLEDQEMVDMTKDEDDGGEDFDRNRRLESMEEEIKIGENADEQR